jgi:hypothetical protein
MNSARRAIFAGFWGGLLAGVFDAVATLLTSSGMLDMANRFHLVAMDGGLGALAGACLAVVFVGWTLALQRQSAGSRWLSAAHAVALLLALPVVVYDAFALFHGAQASRIPGHRFLSMLLILVGAAAIWVAVTLWGRLLARAEPHGAARTSAIGIKRRQVDHPLPSGEGRGEGTALHVESCRGRNHNTLVTSTSGSQEASPSPPIPSPERERGDPSKACVLESRMAISFRR